jgi:hypothetical protein
LKNLAASALGITWLELDVEELGLDAQLYPTRASTTDHMIT